MPGTWSMLLVFPRIRQQLHQHVFSIPSAAEKGPYSKRSGKFKSSSSDTRPALFNFPTLVKCSKNIHRGPRDGNQHRPSPSSRCLQMRQQLSELGTYPHFTDEKTGSDGKQNISQLLLFFFLLSLLPKKSFWAFSPFTALP